MDSGSSSVADFEFGLKSALWGAASEGEWGCCDLQLHTAVFTVVVSCATASGWRHWLRRAGGDPVFCTSNTSLHLSSALCPRPLLPCAPTPTQARHHRCALAVCRLRFAVLG